MCVKRFGTCIHVSESEIILKISPHSKTLRASLGGCRLEPQSARGGVSAPCLRFGKAVSFPASVLTLSPAWMSLFSLLPLLSLFFAVTNSPVVFTPTFFALFEGLKFPSLVRVGSFQAFPAAQSLRSLVLSPTDQRSQVDRKEMVIESLP